MVLYSIALHTMRQDEAFMYRYGTDGWLVTVRGDCGEMLHVDLENLKPLYERYEAPIEKIRATARKLSARGYKVVAGLELAWKPYIDA